MLLSNSVRYTKVNHHQLGALRPLRRSGVSGIHQGEGGRVNQAQRLRSGHVKGEL